MERSRKIIRRQRALSLPAGHYDPDFAAFDRECREIVRRYLRFAHEPSARVAAKRPAAEKVWLRRECFSLITRHLASDRVAFFDSRVQLYGRGQRGAVSENAFQIGLLAVFAHAPDALSAQDRELVGKQLWHAARHFIPIGFLEGFLTQIGTVAIRKRAARNVIEPGFDEWIAFHYARIEGAPDYLGVYPKAIMDQISAYQAEDWG